MPTTRDRSQSLAALEILLGDWTLRPIPQPSWGVVDPDSLVGDVTVEWVLDGAYLAVHTHAPDPIPNSMSLIAEHGDGYLFHYHDSRGVSRVFQMTLADGVWTLWRTEPDFSPLDFAQRFVGEIAADGSAIDGRWEKSFDRGDTWELDFELTYRRRA